jgi:hypothetical protein
MGFKLRQERHHGGRPQGPGDLFGSGFYKDSAPDGAAGGCVMEIAKKFELEILPPPSA